MRRFVWWVGVPVFLLGIGVASCRIFSPPMYEYMVAPFFIPFWAGVTYRSPAIEGMVLDANTGVGVPGAAVVAYWEVRGAPFVGETEPFELLETTTDASGRFAFSAWGPRLRPSPFKFVPREAPKLFVFKEGYLPTSILKNFDYISQRQPVRLQVPSSLANYAEAVEHLAESIPWFVGARCVWASAGKFLARVQHTAVALQEKGEWHARIPLEYWGLEYWGRRINGGACEPVAAVLARYAQ